MMHKEFGFQVVQKFISDVAPYGHPDAPPKLIGKGITVMISPLPRNKRAKNPRVGEGIQAAAAGDEPVTSAPDEASVQIRRPIAASNASQDSRPQQGGFSNNPFSEVDVKVGQ